MLKSPFLFAVSALVTLISSAGGASAEDLSMGLSFALPPVQAQTTESQFVPTAPNESTRTEITAVQTAVAPETLGSSSIALVPSEPMLSDLSRAREALPPLQLSDVEANFEAEPDSVALTFATDTVLIESTAASEIKPPAASALVASSPPSEAVTLSPTPDVLGLDNWIFENGTHSLVARTVGSAEGTRRADGKRTQAYYGHTDPGNGVWNLGTFSYQHGAQSPEEADRKQLKRLKLQGIELESQATQLGMTLSLEEKLNGLDLANQAPLAALDEGGYIDRLAQAKRLQMERDEAILWARTHAYIDPNTRQWNAPGLGNNVHSISEDQARRISAISSALRNYNHRDRNVVSLDRLAQVNLDGTNVASPKLTASVHDTNQSIFNSTISETARLEQQEPAELPDLGISFGLPPASVEEPNDMSTIIATVAPLPILENEALISSSEEQLTIDSDISVAFSPTENVTDTISADSVEITEREAADSEIEEEQTSNGPTADLFSIARLTEIAEQAEPLSAADSVETSVMTDAMTLENAIAPEDKTEPDRIEGVQAQTEASAAQDSAANRKAQLQRLLLGIETSTASGDLKAIQNDELKTEEPQAQPKADPQISRTRQFFRTEDKIVEEK